MPVILFLIALSLFFAFSSLVLFFWMSHRGKKATLYQDDLPGFYSYVTFRPLDTTRGSWIHNERPFFSVFCELLAHRGVRVDALSHVGNAQRVRACLGDVTFEMTMGRVQDLPEQWLLTIDQKFRNGLSAPHDRSDTRAFLLLTRSILLDMEIGTIRWHTRQDWNGGLVDKFTYKPC